MTSPTEALARLQEGNRRFVTYGRVRQARTDEARREELAEGQDPFAVVLGCSDSRVPVELVFDQGLGELFVVRVAGNVVADSQIGSVEYAVEQLGTQLVVVLGHSGCGAVQATLDHEGQSLAELSSGLAAIVGRIRPGIAALEGAPPLADPAAHYHAAVAANVRHSVAQLRRGSPGLARRLETGELLIVGAEYDLESGVVEFLDQPPTSEGSAV